MKKYTRKEIEQLVGRIMADRLGVPERDIRPETTMESLGCDSLDCVDLVMECERRFSIRVSDEDIYGMDAWKVGEFCDLVERLQG